MSNDMNTDELPPIEPMRPRWEPNQDPSSIFVPGLNTNAPVQDQIEQIEQLITIKLQNIDGHFSKIQHILSTQILPAFKRFAVNTEPVREAAKFWVSFFEQAAQVRIPTSDDYAPTYEPQSTGDIHHDTETSVNDVSNTRTFDPNVTPSDSSFLPGQAAVSSTPMANLTRNGHPSSQDSFDSIVDDSAASWEASVESPLDRMNREMQGLEADNTIQSYTSAIPSFSALHGSYTGTLPPPGNTSIPPIEPQHGQPSSHSATHKGKGKAPSLTLRENVLRQNFRTASDSSKSTSGQVSPLKVKPKTPKRNPYIPRNTPRAKWDGIVDLSKANKLQGDASLLSDSDSDDDLPPGMSPPVTMDFVRMPQAAARLGRTPIREAAARIKKDLVGDAEKQRYGSEVESSQSTVLTPPSLSRYTRHSYELSNSSTDPSLEGLFRRVGLSAPASSRNAPQTPGEQPLDSFQDSPGGEVGLAAFASDADSDSSDDSFKEMNTGAPSAEFLALQDPNRALDESFGSSNHSSDSLSGDEGELSEPPVQPFAYNRPTMDGDDSFDESFDDQSGRGDDGEEEQTVFGLPPAQRAGMAPSASGGHLRMLGQDLLDDTIGIGRQRAGTGEVEESPTPWGAGRKP